MTGTTWLEERGIVDGPIMITNTHSVGVVRDAAVHWMVERGWKADWHAPVVAETWDFPLNDVNGFHVTKAHALEAMEKAASDLPLEGAVGGGTGMICNGYKGGIGTSSRLFEVGGDVYTIGVLVQCNYGRRKGLMVRGVAIDPLLDAPPPCFTDRSIKRHVDWFPYCVQNETADIVNKPTRDGSIIIVVATDAPLLPHQLMRVAKRPSLALGRLGSISADGSGDIFIAFSTAGEVDENAFSPVTMYPNNGLSRVFRATIEATEEAILNAMVAAETMIGAGGLRIEEFPEDQVKKVFEE